MPFIDVRIEFDEEIEEFGEGESYKHYSPVSAVVVKTDLEPGDLGSIAEAAGQSDIYTVGLSNAVLRCLDGESKHPVRD